MPLPMNRQIPLDNRPEGLVNHTKTVEIPLDVMWDFIRDFDNWAHLLNGYQRHEVLNDRESVWEVKGTIGKYRRQTKFHATITEWIERQRVVFRVEGVNEMVSGFGIVELIIPDNGHQSTTLSATIAIEAQGVMGALVNRILGPWIKIVAEELVEKVCLAVDDGYTGVRI